MSALPPSYDSAVNPSTTHNTHTHAHESRTQHLAHQDETDAYSSSSDDETSFSRKRRQPTQDEIDERMSIDDEERELPEGLVRAFDKEVSVETRSFPHPPRFGVSHHPLTPTLLRSAVRPPILRRHPIHPTPLNLGSPIRRPNLPLHHPRHPPSPPSINPSPSRSIDVRQDDG